MKTPDYLLSLCMIISIVSCSIIPKKKGADLFDLSITFHGDRLHFRVMSSNNSISPHISSFILCSAVDRNIKSVGCFTQGFTRITVLSPSYKTKNKGIDLRLETSERKLSIKPSQVIPNWPLVYVEVVVKFKTTDHKWLHNGKEYTILKRIDRVNRLAGISLGMPFPESRGYSWKLYVIMFICSCFIVVLTISGVKTRIKTAQRRARQNRPYSRKSTYDFNSDEFCIDIHEDEVGSPHVRYAYEIKLEKMEATKKRHIELAIKAGMLPAKDEKWVD